MMKRREFLTHSAKGLAAAGLLVGGLGSWEEKAEAASPKTTITILHTNDTHSRIDPFERGRFKGMGGVAKRATLVRRLRRENPRTLLVDAGDIFQGTPYFQFFKGRLEFETMSRIGYDFATLGNHDFDMGTAQLLKMAERYAKFSFISANLHFSNPRAQRIIKPYAVKQIAGKRIGFFGLGIRFQGLVSSKMHEGVSYHDPIQTARQMVTLLRNKEKCDAVIMLSHLGYGDFDSEPGDVSLASQVDGIDIIIGGHSHILLKRPKKVRNPNGNWTSIHQVGHSGLYLGKIDLIFEQDQPLRIHHDVHSIGDVP